jgi:3-phenylpropionate/trans-cinnamate dioxygenase alpha subunit
MTTQVRELIERAVAPDAGWIRPEIFADPELYKLEQERIFGRCWLLLGHESQLPQSGSFFRAFMGEEPVLVTRDRDEEIHAFLNVCRHRGAQLCHEDRGTKSKFMCRYHGWTYRNDGKLLGVPGEKSLYYGEIDKDAWGLVPVPRVESYKGLLFGCFDADAVPLVEYLGRMTFYLDVLLDRRAGGTELLGVQRWRIGANWKVVCENHIGDEYHVGFTHGSQMPQEIGNRAEPLPLAREVRAELGHGLGVNVVPEGTPMSARVGNLDPVVGQYLMSIEGEIRERLSEIQTRLVPIHGLVFPNLGMVPVFNAFRVVHPISPSEVELWAYCLVDAEAPKEVKAALARQAVTTFGPAGGFEQDDAANWRGATRTSQSPQARKHRVNLQMGLGHEEQVPGLPGLAGKTASDINQRGFYLRYVQEMLGESA